MFAFKTKLDYVVASLDPFSNSLKYTSRLKKPKSLKLIYTQQMLFHKTEQSLMFKGLLTPLFVDKIGLCTDVKYKFYAKRLVLCSTPTGFIISLSTIH